MLLTPGQLVHAGVLKEDVRQLLSWRSAGVMALGVGLSVAVHPCDQEVVDLVDKPPLPRLTRPYTNFLFGSRVAIPAAAGTWAVGATAHVDEVRQLGSLLSRALGYTQMIVGTTKLIVGRRRPDGSDDRSFPSGHSANAFAMATALHRHCGRCVGVPLYAIATLTAAGRMEADKHYFSDVVTGAATGVLVAWSITRDTDNGSALRIVPGGAGGPASVAIGLRF